MLYLKKKIIYGQCDHIVTKSIGSIQAHEITALSTTPDDHF